MRRFLSELIAWMLGVPPDEFARLILEEMEKDPKCPWKRS